MDALSAGSGSYGMANPAYTNQEPKDLFPTLLVHTTVEGNIWTPLLSSPRSNFIVMKNYYLHNRTATAADVYFAFAGVNFDNTLALDQDDVFQIAASMIDFLIDEQSGVALNPSQALWIYSTQKINVHLSGIKVTK